jgi:hypothetical protein
MVAYCVDCRNPPLPMASGQRCSPCLYIHGVPKSRSITSFVQPYRRHTRRWEGDHESQSNSPTPNRTAGELAGREKKQEYGVGANCMLPLNHHSSSRPPKTFGQRRCLSLLVLYSTQQPRSQPHGAQSKTQAHLQTYTRNYPGQILTGRHEFGRCEI